MTTLPAVDFVLRAPSPDDAQTITDLMVAHDMAEIGRPKFALETLMNDWNAPDFDLSNDARIALTPQGEIIGYESIINVAANGRIQIDGCVHPGHLDCGIGTALLSWAQSRAREHVPEFPNDLRICTQLSAYGNAARSAALMQAEGYAVVRHFWQMEIDLTEPPPAPRWPAGITVRSFISGQDEYAAWQALNSIFEDDWELSPLSFEDWLAKKIENESSDPSLWFLAMAGDQIAAMSRGTYQHDNGWIRTFGVCRPWRRQGLAIALLHHTFAEFYRRGKFNVGLGVDSQNVTGATRVYERAGMHATLVFDTYEKELRSGRSPK